MLLVRLVMRKDNSEVIDINKSIVKRSPSPKNVLLSVKQNSSEYVMTFIWWLPCILLQRKQASDVDNLHISVEGSGSRKTNWFGEINYKAATEETWKLTSHLHVSLGGIKKHHRTVLQNTPVHRSGEVQHTQQSHFPCKSLQTLFLVCIWVFRFGVETPPLALSSTQD